MAGTATAVRIVVGAVALRWALVLCGLGPYLQWRVNVSTPSNSLAGLREGLLLQRLGVSPWAGSQCRTPALVLQLEAWTAQHAHLYALPNIMADIMSALMLRAVAAQQLPRAHQGLQVSPDTVMGLFLLNPLTVATCVSGVTSSLHITSCVALLYLATCGSWVGSAALLATAAYQDLHSALLLVAVVMLLIKGPESQTLTAITEQHSTADDSQTDAADATPPRHSSTATGSVQQASSGLQQPLQPGSVQPSLPAKPPSSYSTTVIGAIALLCATAAWLAVLFCVSDWVVQGPQPDARCVPRALSWCQSLLFPSPAASQLLPSTAPTATTSTTHSSSTSSPHSSCWALSVYQLPILVEDQTPNIGQVWYLFTEMFPPYLALFRFVVHSLAAVLVIPLALRFPHRPLFLFTLQCVINCMFKPYPSVADHVLYLALLPLLQEQLVLLQQGLMLVTSFLLLAVLEGSMWHQWINIESANSNFYYSITLLIGAWQTLVVVMLCMLTVKADRLHKQQAQSRSTDSKQTK